MKRLFCFGVFALTLSIAGFAQTMQASIGAGSAPTRIRIYIRPTTAVNGNISTLQFTVAIPAAITPVPTLSIVGTPAIGSGWQIDQGYTDGGTGVTYPYVEGAFRHYQITTAASFTVNIGAGVETQVMELQFNNGPSTPPSNVALVTMPGGGTTTANALFFCSGAANSVSGQLYYTRAGTVAVNLDSYNSSTDVSTATVGGIVLPVNWLSFEAVRNGNDGLLNWKVDNEDANLKYEIQRSLNGSDFMTIATVNKVGTGNGVKAYTFTDPNIVALGSTVVYYRLKQFDIDGRTSFSPIRQLKLNIRKGEISVFPNPVKGDGFYVNIPFETPTSKEVKLSLFSSTGQLIRTKQITELQSTNYYFDIKAMNLAAGQYQLQITHDGQVLENKKLMVSKN